MDYLRDPKTGRFIPGTKGGPGRKTGSRMINFVVLCEKKAKELNINLEDLVWSVVKRLFVLASQGDVQAAKLILDRICGPVDKLIELNFDNRSLTISTENGDSKFNIGEFSDYLKKLNEVAIQQGLISGDEIKKLPSVKYGMGKIIDMAAKEFESSSEMEDLLS